MIIKKLLVSPVAIMLLLLALFVASLAGLLIYNQINQQPLKGSLSQINLPPTVAQFKLKYKYIGELPKLKDRTTVYSVSESPVLNSDIANNLAQPFGLLTKEPQVLRDIKGDVYLYQSEQESLFIYPKPLRLEYRNSKSPLPSQLLLSQLEQTATEYIEKMNFIKAPLSPSKPQIQPMAIDFQGVTFPVGDISHAELVEFRYQLLLDNLPIIPKDRQQTALILLLNLDGSIKKATILILSDQIKTLGSATISDPEDALDALNAGLGRIALLSDPTQAYTEIKSDGLEQADLTSLELIYLYDYDQLVLQPYYRFSGTAKTKEDNLISIEVLITALPQEVYK